MSTRCEYTLIDCFESPNNTEGYGQLCCVIIEATGLSNGCSGASFDEISSNGVSRWYKATELLRTVLLYPPKISNFAVDTADDGVTMVVLRKVWKNTASIDYRLPKENIKTISDNVIGFWSFDLVLLPFFSSLGDVCFIFHFFTERFHSHTSFLLSFLIPYFQ